MAGMAFSGIEAVTVVPAPVPETFAVVMSAAPKSRARADGLSGAASTRRTTSSAAGAGIGTATSESSSVPSALTRVRSWRPLAERGGVTVTSGPARDEDGERTRASLLHLRRAVRDALLHITTDVARGGTDWPGPTPCFPSLLLASFLLGGVVMRASLSTASSLALLTLVVSCGGRTG